MSNRPQYLKPIPSAIPDALKARPQWVLWKGVFRYPKWTKPPFQKNGNNASCSDPSTWADFDTVEAAYRLDSGWDGYGFVLTVDDPFCGIDLDHVRDRASGKIEGWALDLIRRFDSYTEVSPSGGGVRIFIKGSLPEKGKHGEKIEIYDRRRFLTTTGHRIEDERA